MGIVPETVRAVCFTRSGAGAAALVDQRRTFEAVCAARGWSAGPVVVQLGSGGGRAWPAVRRMVRARLADVVVVDALATVAASEEQIAREVVLLRHAGVRLLVAAEAGVSGGRVAVAR